MVAIRAKFDGKKIVVPEALRGTPAGEVIVIFPDAPGGDDARAWLMAQEPAFAEVWDNDEAAVYDDPATPRL